MTEERINEKNGLAAGCSRQEESDEGLNDMLEKLAQTQGNIVSYINSVPRKLIEDLDDDAILDKLRLGVRELLTNMNSLIGPLVEVKTTNDKKIQQLETSCGEWIYHMKNKQKEVDSMQEKIQELNNEVAGQINFCTHLGAVLGTLIWKSSRSSPMVDNWLQQNLQILDDFLAITTTALTSFIHTFAGKFPDTKEEQYQFMMSLLGTVSNISSNATGRSFLIGHANGKELIKHIVLGIPEVPAISGDPMKRLMLMIVYNVSLHRAGLPYLLDLKVHESIADCAADSAEIQLNFLRVVQSVTYDLRDVAVSDRLLEILPVIKIQEFRASSDERIADAATGIWSNINKIYASADTISDKSMDN